MGGIPRAAERPGPDRSYFSRDRRLAYYFLAPGLLGLLVFTLVPLLGGVALSFFRFDYFDPRPPAFIGLQNYVDLVTQKANPYFWRAVVNNLYWVVAVIAGHLVLGYLCALQLNRKFWGREIHRALLMVPWVIPNVVAILTWQWMYNTDWGLINYYLRTLGLIQDNVQWLTDVNLAMPSLIIVGWWKGLPFMTLMLLAGLQAIPDDIYEAARVDGANALQRFLYMTLPQMRTITTISLVLTTIWWFNSLDFQRIVTLAGVQIEGVITLPLLSYMESFQFYHLGRGAAGSTFILLILGVLMFYAIRREAETRI